MAVGSVLLWFFTTARAAQPSFGTTDLTASTLRFSQNPSQIRRKLEQIRTLLSDCPKTAVFKPRYCPSRALALTSQPSYPSLKITLSAFWRLPIKSPFSDYFRSTDRHCKMMAMTLLSDPSTQLNHRSGHFNRINLSPFTKGCRDRAVSMRIYFTIFCGLLAQQKPLHFQRLLPTHTAQVLSPFATTFAA